MEKIGHNLIDSRTRSIVKGIVWRSLATLATIALVYIFFHDVTKAFEVGLVEVFLKLLLYYGHERAWNVVKWGKVPIKVNFAGKDND